MINVFSQEKRDGLEKLVASTNAIAYIGQAKFLQKTDQAIALMRSVAGVNEDMDLYPIGSVLASIGWNANDDVFDKIETFRARATPINKPFNFMHNEADIIGHITNSAVLDSAGKLIANTEQTDEIPDVYDVVSEAVLYKCWSDKKLQERMDKIIAEIKEDKWFVSMECLFAGFDYAVILPNDEHKIIARNEASAFLTKHLRAYGGTGSYQDYKVGRLLRNFAFSGKGLVDNPANKRSIIFNGTNVFKGAKASVTILNKGKLMDEVLKAQLDETKKTLDTVVAENKTLVAKAKEVADKAVADQIASVNKAVSEKDAALATKETTIATLTTEKTKVEADLATANDKITVLTAEVAAMKAEAVKAGRLSKLASAGVTGEDATKLMDKFASATEEMFDEIVAMKSEAVKKAKEDEGDGANPKDKSGKAAKNGNEDKVKTGKEGSADEADKKVKSAKVVDDDKDSKDKGYLGKGKSAADDDDDDGAKAAAAAKVDELPASTEATLNTPPEDKAEVLRTAASAWIKNNVLKSNKTNTTK